MLVARHDHLRVLLEAAVVRLGELRRFEDGVGSSGLRLRRLGSREVHGARVGFGEVLLDELAVDGPVGLSALACGRGGDVGGAILRGEVGVAGDSLEASVEGRRADVVQVTRLGTGAASLLGLLRLWLLLAGETVVASGRRSGRKLLLRLRLILS